MKANTCIYLVNIINNTSLNNTNVEIQEFTNILPGFINQNTQALVFINICVLLNLNFLLVGYIISKHLISHNKYTYMHI